LDDTRNVIIIGAGRSASELNSLFKTHVLRGYNILGVFDNDPLKVNGDQIYLGDIYSSMDYISQHKVNEIFCTLPYSQNKVIENLMLLADKSLIRFRLVPEYHEYIKKTIQVQNFGNVPVISFRQEPLESVLNRAIKRLFDIIFSLLIIVFIFSWLFPILAVLIKLESRGPIFFIQRRSGRNNKSFNCYKLRSMYVNYESDHKQAIRGDSRITKTGAFFRKTNIDELPQFFNVLVGNMSTVGPRPHMISHTEQYSKLIDKFMVRHFLKPGITGWAQINGLRGETKTTQAMLERVEADVWYLENWSFLLDLKIVFLTIWNIIKGDKNAF
jgi:putative colanic acid biosynthesis UDP-glucose lipid carrier transferase